MKKLRGIMAILAATALIFGTVACSGGDDNNNNNPKPTDQSDPISGGGSGESDPISGGGGSEGGDDSTTGDPVTYKWSFNEDTFDVTKFITVKNSGGADKYGLAEDYEYASTPSGMVMTLKAATGGDAHYNLVDKTKTIGSSTVYYGTATVGCVEPNGDLVVLKNVQGPFTVTAYVQCNSSSDKTDRYGYIKIGDEEFADVSYKASTTLPAAGQVLTAKYDSSDKVDVVIGCAKIMRIYDVVVTTAAAQDQSTAETNAGSMTISADKTTAKVGSKVTWTLTANNMDVPSTVDIYVDGSSTPFITGVALTDGKYEMTVKEAWLETDEDDDPIETTVKVFVKSGNVSSNKVTITFVPADETTVYKDGTVADFEKDFTDDEIAYISAMTDAEIESFIAGVYTDAACETPVTEGYEGDIWIKLNKTKEELKALIDAAIAAATKYTVTFDANGGAFAAGATTSVEVVSGLSVSTEQLATISEPAKTDYTFLGWATTADATEAADLSTVTISGATTLYAVWKSNIVTAVWDWEGTTKPIVAETADATTSTTLQSGATGFATVNAGGNAVSIVVAATGKLSTRDSDAQFNNGTVLKVPVSAGSVVYVKTKAGTYAVNGVKSQAAETTYSAATSAGYVELKATGNDYIYKISVTGLKVTDDFTSQASLTAVPATSLTLSETEALDKTVEDSFTLSATVAPATRTSKVVWTVEGDAVTIASQDDLDAKFTAVAAGTATIKATCDEQVATLTVNVTAASANAFKVTYFDSEHTAFSAAGVSSNESVVTAADAVATAEKGTFAGAYGTVNNVASHYYTNSTKATWAKNGTLLTVTMTLTAGQNIKIVKITGECNESTTGNISRTLKVGSADAVSLGSGKAVTISVDDINQTVAAGSTIDIVITSTATADISSKTMKQLFKDIIINGEIVE
ncbi:MAG: InlB B-repeat-containing protein [Treponema sp.]|nr:InlB B-repeat-containing protein [Treponema sp.]